VRNMGKTTVFVGGTIWQAKQEIRRRIAKLPPGSIERVGNYMIELVNGDTLLARSGQDPRCLRGLDPDVTVVTVGELHLIKDEVWDSINHRFSGSVAQMGEQRSPKP
jgi:hypothetical protein